MEIPLTSFEIQILDKIIPTQTLSDPQSLQFNLHNLINQDKDRIMQSEHISEQEFKVLQAQTAKNIFQFLRANDFFYEREGGLFFLTEKIKYLRQQGSIEKYHEWEQVNALKKADELRIIESRGYLDKDQDPREHKDNIWKETRSLDYDQVTDSVKPNHPPLPSHKFATKPGKISGRGGDQKKTLLPVIIGLLVLALLVIAHYLKMI